MGQTIVLCGLPAAQPFASHPQGESAEQLEVGMNERQSGLRESPIAGPGIKQEYRRLVPFVSRRIINHMKPVAVAALFGACCMTGCLDRYEGGTAPGGTVSTMSGNNMKLAGHVVPARNPWRDRCAESSG